MMEGSANRPSGEAGYLAEYASLRDEILMRIRMRNQNLVFTIGVLGIILSLSTQQDASAIIFFLYPVLAAFLALRWAWSDVRIWEIGSYIKENIEPNVPGLGWEAYMHTLRMNTLEEPKRSSIFRPTEASAMGLFFVAGIVAFALGLSRFTSSREEWILATFSGVAIAATLRILGLRRRRIKQI